MITSKSNPKIKHLKELIDNRRSRTKDGAFVVEGYKMFIEAPTELIREIYIDAEVYDKLKESCSETPLSVTSDRVKNKTIEKLRECEGKAIYIETVSHELMIKVSDTETPQGIIVVLDQLKYELKDLLGSNMLILENIQDPGNLGTMIRTAEGAGVSGILMTKGCVDIYNPKTVRSTMGSLYRVPIRYTDDLKNDIDVIKKEGVRVYAAHLNGRRFYDEIEYSTDSAFMIGNEGNGLTDETANMADEYLKIPMAGQLESLNAAVSASILMYNARNRK